MPPRRRSTRGGAANHHETADAVPTFAPLTDATYHSHEVAAEIYKYRCRTLEYDMTSSSLAAEAAGVAEEEEKGGKSPEQLKRELFIARVQNIYARAMDGELSSGGALRHTGFLAANIEAPRERAVFVEKLRAHVLTNVYEARLKCHL